MPHSRYIHTKLLKERNKEWMVIMQLPSKVIHNNFWLDFLWQCHLCAFFIRCDLVLDKHWFIYLSQEKNSHFEIWIRNGLHNLNSYRYSFLKNTQKEEIKYTLDNNLQSISCIKCYSVKSWQVSLCGMFCKKFPQRTQIRKIAYSVKNKM